MVLSARMEKTVLMSDFVKMSKQDKRLANKKRKAEVLLNLLSQKNKRDESDTKTEEETSDGSVNGETDASPIKKPKPNNSTDSANVKKSDKLDEKTLIKIEKKKQKKQRLKEIRMKIKKLQKLESNAKERPTFHMTLQELLEQQLRGRSEAERQVEELPTLYMLDVQHLLTLALLPDSYTHYPRWCKLSRPGKIATVVVIVLDQLSAPDLEEYHQCFPFMKKTFQVFAEVVSPYQYNSSVMKDLFRVPTSNTALKYKAYKERNRKGQPQQQTSEFKQHGNEPGQNDKDISQEFNRKHLLLNPIQLMHEGYPMPVRTVTDRYKDFQFSFENYKAVTRESPMFAVDCEMCLTKAGESELTRISVVNEKLETVYDTLVKPHNKITHYLTQYSGITKKMLEPVKTRLKEVQTKLRQLLPSDSIWLGQSLNNDLMALKLFHPYVIDTSVIYNLSGFKWKKTGLKVLTAQFLNQDIQMGAEGHSSVEDARATMELVQLKLKKGMSFGDATLTAMEVDEEEMNTVDDRANKQGKLIESELKAEKDKTMIVEKTETDMKPDVAKDLKSLEEPQSAEFAKTEQTVNPMKAGTEEESKASELGSQGEGKQDTEANHSRQLGTNTESESGSLEVAEEKVLDRRRLFFQQQQGQYQNFLTMAQKGKKSAVVIDKKEVITGLESVPGAKYISASSDKARTQGAVDAVRNENFVWVQLHAFANLTETSQTGSNEIDTEQSGEETGTANIEKIRGEKGTAESESEAEDGEIKDDPQKLKCLKRLDKRVRRIVRRVKSKSLLCVVLSGQSNQDSVHNAGVLIKIT